MSRKFLVSLDLSQNQLLNAQIQNLAVAPGTPVTGQIYYNTSTNSLLFYNGSGWIPAGGFNVGTLGARPAAGASNSGTFYYATDNFLIYYSNGTTWQQADAFGVGQSTTVAIAGATADGTSTNFARADHAHSGPGFAAPTAQTAFGAASAPGSAATVPRSDHTHGTPSLSAVTPAPITTTGAAGVGTVAATSDHAHAFTPSNFALSAFGVPVATVSMNNQVLTGLAAPVSATDAVNKAYADAIASGLNPKNSVLAATTPAGGNITLSAPQTIDGIALVAGNRVLVKNQTTAAQNGIYVVAAGAWARSADQQVPTQGDFTFIETGTANAAQGWILGTSATLWTQFSAAGEYVAGSGIAISGTSIAFNPLTAGGLQIAAGGASILLPTNSGLGLSAAGIAVGAGTGIAVVGGLVSVSSTTPQKFSQTLATSATSYTITHSLNTLDVHVQVYTIADGSEVEVDNLRATVNSVTLNFGTAPSASAYRVVIIG